MQNLRMGFTRESEMLRRVEAEHREQLLARMAREAQTKQEKEDAAAALVENARRERAAALIQALWRGYQVSLAARVNSCDFLNREAAKGRTRILCTFETDMTSLLCYASGLCF